MMAALPQTQTPALPSLFAMLTPLQPGGTGEEGGFDQLVAAQGAAPVAPAVPKAIRIAMPLPQAAQMVAAPIATTPAQPVPTEYAPSALPVAVTAAPVETLSPAAVPMVAAQATALPLAKAPSVATTETAKAETADAEPAADTPAPRAETAAPDKAVVAANELLATLAHFTAPAPKAAPVKAAVAAAEGEEAITVADETEATTVATPAIALVANAPAPAETRTTAKPVADAAPATPRARDEAPALAAPAPKAREGAAVLALPALTAEPLAAKPAAEPSMTVLFAQPATAATTAIGTATPIATIAERVLDLTSDDAWIEQLASDIAATRSASNDVSFRLMPRHLGRLDVSMMMGDEGMSLKLDTQHEATATIVTAAQVRLVDDLRQQGVRVADTQVTHTPTESGRQSQQGQGRSPAQDAAHLIETATERDPRETRDQERAGDRRGRFA